MPPNLPKNIHNLSKISHLFPTTHSSSSRQNHFNLKLPKCKLSPTKENSTHHRQMTLLVACTTSLQT